MESHKRFGYYCFVHDSTKTITSDELILLETIREENRKELIISNNKVDLKTKKLSFKDIPQNILTIETSSIIDTGIERLKHTLFKMVIDKSQAESKESVVITNERHYSALLKAQLSLTSALDSLKTWESEEFVAVDLRSAIDSIGEIVGLVTTEEMLNEIFSKFCIGK